MAYGRAGGMVSIGRAGVRACGRAGKQSYSAGQSFLNVRPARRSPARPLALDQLVACGSPVGRSATT